MDLTIGYDENRTLNFSDYIKVVVKVTKLKSRREVSIRDRYNWFEYLAYLEPKKDFKKIK